MKIHNNDLKTREAILQHYKNYPDLQIQDIFKFLYQSVFGPEHFIDSKDAAINNIVNEYIASNSHDLIDGLDGLAGGITSIFFMTIIVICFFQGRTTGLEFTLALIMLGSTLGFLVHNFNPAKIFAGDSGALFLGFIFAITFKAKH